MRALITGAAGFVGRHMMKGLARRGWDVFGVDIREGPWFPSSATSWLPTSSMARADARDIFNRTILPNERWDLVVHCAYHVGGRVAIDGEPRLLARNLELDAGLFRWALATEQKRVLYYSSSAAYPVEYQTLDQWKRLHEKDIDLDHVMQPDARYGWAKLTGERLAEAAKIDGLRVHIARPFSGYGADQDLTYPFPAILQRVRQGDMSVWGPAGQCRDWIHIDDVVGCSIAMVEQDVVEPVNICSGIGVEFGSLAIRMARLAGTEEPKDPTYLVNRPTGVMVRVGDPTTMRTIYTPQISLEEGITRALGTP